MARTGGSAHPETRESTPLAARVFAALCDGRFHSGEQLARSLGVSRSAIWKAAGTLRVPRVRGGGGWVRGVGGRRPLRFLGGAGAGPNGRKARLRGGGKRGGVLTDRRAEPPGPACVVIGIGVNMALGAALLQRITETGV